MADGNLFTRSDTFFGVCEGLGQDLGFNPNILRAAFGVGVLMNPPLVAALYALLGIVVLATRLLAPVPKPRSKAEITPLPVQPKEREDLPLAA